MVKTSIIVFKWYFKSFFLVDRYFHSQSGLQRCQIEKENLRGSTKKFQIDCFSSFGGGS